MFIPDRYLKIVLTIIAIELLWLGSSGGSPRLDAQSGAMPVVITGVTNDESPTGPITPLLVQIVGPVKVEADRPLRVENVPHVPSPFPGD